jgi:uncharacterized protein (TIGR03437 family)
MNKILSLLALAAGMAAFGQAGTPVIQAVVNAADYSSAVVEGGYLTVFGTGLAGATAVAQSTPFPTQLGGTSVEIRETNPFGVGRTFTLPLYYVSPGQISALLPYGLGTAAMEFVVVNGGQRSAARRVGLSTTGPRLFTYSQLGTGTAVLTRANNQLVTATTPLRPGEVMQLYLNSAGPVEPALTAGTVSGDGRGLGPLRRMTNPVDVTINGRRGEVLFAGMSPGSVGLYQINFRAPYDEVEGDLRIQVQSGSAQSQNGVFVRSLPNGFYWVITGGKAANGLALDGVSGPTSAFAYRHDDERQWSANGLRQWTKDTGLPGQFSAAKGVALTMRNGSQIVFDNNGLETGTTDGYYDNRNGGADAQKPGLLSMYSNSVRRSNVMAGAFRLTEPTRVTEMIGYFEGPSFLRAFPFFPDNFFNRFRMNIWSNGAGDAPRDTGTFTGDVFSSDQRAGKFSYSTTGVSRVFQQGQSNEIYRLRYELAEPLVLQPGTYWFSHDVAVPKLEGPGGAATVSRADGERVREVLPGSKPYSMRDDE